MIDLRVIRVGLEIDGKMNLYNDLKVVASGVKYANPLQNECSLVITGLNRETRNYLIRESKNKESVIRLTLEVGRQSSGLFVLYVGDVISAESGIPPDVTLTIKAKTNNANNAKIVTTNGSAMQKLSEIAQIVATNNDLGLKFEAQDKNIANYSFSGVASRQIHHLQQAGQVKAFVDDNTLIVKDDDKAAQGRRRILSANTGMVGIPKDTETGIEVTYLINSESDLGGQLTIDSKMNESVNGDYIIEQLKFSVASHDNPFFYTAVCKRL